LGHWADEFDIGGFEHGVGRLDEGDETARVQREFLKNWVRVGGSVPEQIAPTRRAAGGTAWVQSVVTDPLLHKTELREAQLKMIRFAEKEIWVAYPYFSDDLMINELIAAKRRNPKLDIKVMMPGKGERGIPGFLYAHLNMATAKQLLDVGIEPRFLSTRLAKAGEVEVFSHFKGMVVDGKLLSLGSANGDARTLQANHELNTIIHDKEAATRFITEIMAPDWKRSKPVTGAQWDAQPFWKKWVSAALEAVDFLF
jgi:cardiolipin synthase